MPSLGMYTAEGTLTNWLRPDGATVAAGEPIAEVTTEKATYEIEAPTAGVLHPVAAVGSDHAVQGLLGYVLEPGEAPPAVSQAPRPTAASAATAPSERAGAGESATVVPRPAGEIKATPVARRLAGQHGLDLAIINGSGPGGRIVEADVLAAVERRQHAPALSSAPGAIARRVRRRVPLVGIRRTVGERLRQSLATAVPVTLTREADAAALVEARAALAAPRAVPSMPSSWPSSPPPSASSRRSTP
jgi:pyruvate/2-oxoglutarate dehydrogenase complex dihydrolipoamide acyltransferase (E2) component